MKITNNFVLGNINKDADERLVPNGSLRDLENIITNASEGKDKGALENVLGNMLIVNNDLPNAIVLGSGVNLSKRKVYYFVHSTDYDYIFEYDGKSNVNTIVLQTSTNGGLLNFNPEKRIINVDVINKGAFGSRDESSFSFVSDLSLSESFSPLLNQSYQNIGSFEISESLVRGVVIRINFDLEDDNGTEIKRNFIYRVLSDDFEAEKESLRVAILDFINEIEIVSPIETNTIGSVFTASVVEDNNTFTITTPRKVYFQSGQSFTNGINIESAVVQTLFPNEEDSDLVAFSGDDNQPRIINVERCKTYGIDEIKSTDLNLIKPSPILAPELELFNDITTGNNLEDKFLSFAYRYRYKDGYYSAKSSASEYAFSPREFNIDFDNFENVGMQNIFNSVKIKYNSGDENVEEIDLLFKESTSLNWNIIESIKKEEEGLDNNEQYEFVFSNNKVYRVLPEQEYFRSFDNVPLKAFSQVYAQGRLLYGNYIEQRNLIDKEGRDCKILYDVGFVSDEAFDNRAIVTNENLFLLGFRIKIDFNSLPSSIANKLMIFDMSLNGLDISGNIRDNIVFSYVYQVPENIDTLFQLISETDFPDRIQQDFNQLVKDNDTEPQGTTETIERAQSFRVVYINETSFGLRRPSVNYIVNDEPVLRRFEDDGNTTVNLRSESGTSSMKSNRNYEVSQIYLDGEGRKTTSLTSNTNDVFIPNVNALTKNTIKVTIPQEQKPPKWAKYYKFAIKKTQKWENIYSNIFYEDGFFRWIKLEGSDINKVDIGDDILCKRDVDGVLEEPVKLKVLDKQYFEEDFIEGSVDADGRPIKEMRGQYIKVKPSGISLDYQSGEFLRFEGSIADDRTTSGQPHSILGGFLASPNDGQQLFAIEDENENLVDRPIGIGSVFSLSLRNTRSGRPTYTSEITSVSNQEYDNIKDFMIGQFPSPPDLPTQTSNGQALQTPPTGAFRAEGGEGNQLFLYWVERVKRIPSENISGATVLRDQENNPMLGMQGFMAFELDNTQPYSIVIKGINGGTSTRRSKLYPSFSLRLVDGYTVFETVPKEIEDNVFYETPETYHVINGEHQQSEHLLTKAFNCFVQGNGAESYQIKDQFNANKLIVDYTPTAVSSTRYRELRRFADITYSTGIFNDSSGINGLNQFNLSEANFKDDIEKSFGSINKMVSRDTNIVVMQEDKISQVLIGKSEFFNADGSSSVSRIDTILGQQVPYAGDYGIDTDPESVVSTKNDIYFADKKRGVVCRLGYNGLFEISSRGMTSYFRNLFSENEITQIIGCYDDYYDVYMINIKYIEDEEEKYVTWGYKENINESGGGWVTKQTFNPQEMIKYVNTFISFDKGNLYKHNARQKGEFGKFYGEEFGSSFKFIFSQEPLQRKVFKTIEIDGTDAWDVDVKTNLQKGYISLGDFRNQENVFRSYIRGEKEALDLATLSVQGLGILKFSTGNNELYFDSINPEFNVGDLILNSDGLVIGKSIDVNFDLGFITLDEFNTDLEEPQEGDFIALAKPLNIETSGLLGYFMEVEAKLKKKEKTEVFAISSEVFASASNT